MPNYKIEIINDDNISPGDVIFVMGVSKENKREQAINQETISAQKTVLAWKSSLGDYATHTAICIGKNQSGLPIIAHLMDHVFFDRYDEFKQEHRSCVLRVFKPCDNEVRSAFENNELNIEEKSKNITWKRSSAHNAFRPSSSSLRTTQKKYQKRSICSTYALDVLKDVLQSTQDNNLIRKYCHISKYSSPKSVFNYLSSNPNYKKYIVFNECDLYGELINLVNRECDRLASCVKNKSAKEKSSLITRAMAKASMKIFSNNIQEQLSKIRILLNHIMPHVKIKRGLFESTTQKKIKKLFLKFGLPISALSYEDILDLELTEPMVPEAEEKKEQKVKEIQEDEDAHENKETINTNPSNSEIRSHLENILRVLQHQRESASILMEDHYDDGINAITTLINDEEKGSYNPNQISEILQAPCIKNNNDRVIKMLVSELLEHITSEQRQSIRPR